MSVCYIQAPRNMHPGCEHGHAYDLGNTTPNNYTNTYTIATLYLSPIRWYYQLQYFHHVTIDHPIIM